MEGKNYAWIAIVCGTVGLAGCRSRTVPPFTDYRTVSATSVPVQGPAFGSFEEAASQVRHAIDQEARQAVGEQRRQAAANLLKKVSFTPDDKKLVYRVTERAIGTIGRAVRQAGGYRFEPSEPFVPRPDVKEWRLISRGITWRIGDAIKEEQYDRAIQLADTATRLGFFLNGADCATAMLGLTIVNEARVAIAPSMMQFGAAQLRNLSRAIKAAYLGCPPVAITLQNEHQTMRYAVQAVQQAYQSEQYRELSDTLKDDARPAITYLRDLHAKDSSKRPAYFDGFAEDADDEFQLLIRWSAIPTVERKTPEPTKEDRPWKRFGRHFFSSGRPYLGLLDLTRTRTQLLVLEAEIARYIKLTKKAPADLKMFDPKLALDPYSGKTFRYHAQGMEYRIYSVGIDGTDNGGDTDSAYWRPDLTLERQ